jgi:hypothetical protein
LDDRRHRKKEEVGSEIRLRAARLRRNKRVAGCW